jgi:hypothetical protein
MKRLPWILIVAASLVACGDDDDGVALGGACTLDTECSDGLYCAETSTCLPIGAYQSCTYDTDCPGTWHCGDDLVCLPDGYRTPCTYDTDCRTGSFCSPDLECLPKPDATPTACTEASECVGARGACAELGYCVGLVPEGFGQACDGTTPCPTGLLCAQGSGGAHTGGGYCTFECYPYAPFAECPAGSVCLELGDRPLCGVLCTIADGCTLEGIDCEDKSGYTVCWRGSN